MTWKSVGRVTGKAAFWTVAAVPYAIWKFICVLGIGLAWTLKMTLYVTLGVYLLCRG